MPIYPYKDGYIAVVPKWVMDDLKSQKTHKKHGTVRTDLSKRKKPTVAKHAGPEFRSRRVKPTQKERIMAKAHQEYDEPAPAPTTDPPEDIHEVLDRLIHQMELSAQHNAPISPAMIETVKALHDQLP